MDETVAPERDIFRQPGSGKCSTTSFRVLSIFTLTVPFLFANSLAAGIVHQDIKPSNLLLHFDDMASSSPENSFKRRSPRILISDFGEVFAALF